MITRKHDVPRPPQVRPRDWTAPPSDVLMADGVIAVIRPLREDDRETLLSLHESVSEDTLRLRFFTPSRNAGRAYVAHLFDPENTGSAALVALVRGRLAAVATAELLSPDSAEVAFLVSDDDRGRGLGSLLLEHLAALGRQHGVSRFVADVLADNYGMLRVFRSAGFAATRKTDQGDVSVELRIDASQEVIAAADRREWQAEARSLRPLLYPASVAVVGVRRSAGGFGYGVLDAIRSSPYGGQLVVVHPEADAIEGLPTHRSLAAVGSPVDLVVIALPAEQVAGVLRDAARAGAGAVLVISSGFAGHAPHDSAAGRAGTDDLLALARAHGVRMVGPNSQGVLGNDPDLALNATLLHDVPAPGGLAVASQSGGMGFALLDLARDLGLGVHAFVSLGDKVDVSSNDLLAAWMGDPRVTAAALYLESFGNALKFARTARRFSERKPLLAVVGGRTRARLERTTGAAAPVAVDALLAQSGVIACRTGAELTETALLLTEQPLPAGLRVGIVSNTGGLGALTMDLVDAQGLALVPFSPDLQRALHEAAAGAVDARNPVDLGADVAPDALADCLATLLGAGEVDALVVLLVATRLSDRDALFAAVARARTADPETPVLLVAPGAAAVAARGLVGVTVYRTTEAATGALGRSMRYAEWRRVPADQPVVGLGTRGTHARSWADARLADRGGEPEWLTSAAMTDLLAPYGVQQVGSVVGDADAAAAAAAGIGFPVVVKVADPTELHKTDRGLVRIDLRTAEDVTAAVHGFAAELGRESTDVVVQPMLLGHQVAVSVRRDPDLGPLVRVAAGGWAAEGWDDEVLLLRPVGPSDASRAVRALRLWPQLLGHHGLEPVDVGALEALVVSVGQLAVDVPQLAELTLDPVVLTADGLHCVDVKARLVAPSSLDAGVPRRLRS